MTRSTARDLGKKPGATVEERVQSQKSRTFRTLFQMLRDLPPPLTSPLSNRSFFKGGTDADLIMFLTDAGCDL